MKRRFFFVAEVSSNHHRDLDRCLRFIDVAAEIGCDAVKFQLFRLEDLFAPEVLRAKPEVRKRKDWELPVSYLPNLAARCRERGVLFSCTPFYLDAVAELLPHVDFFKVASYELLWDALLRACADTGKPLVLSTGMATMDEIRHAVGVVEDAQGAWRVAQGAESGVRRVRTGGQGSGAHIPHFTSHIPYPQFGESLALNLFLPPLTLLHCVSGYPAPVEQCNLAAIQTLREAFGATPKAPAGPCTGPAERTSVGWSDHSVDCDVILRAISRWGATMIEFHLDLDGTGDEFKTGHCWLPAQMAAVIKKIRELGARATDCDVHRSPRVSDHLPMDGTGIKAPVPSELPDRDWRADPSDGLRPLQAMRRTLQPAGKA